VGIEELKDVVAARGRDRVAALRRDAEAEAARLREEAESEIGRETARRLDEEKATLEREAGVRIAEARGAARRRVLMARQDLLERIFAAARRSAEGEPIDEASFEMWTSRIRRALAQLPAGPATLVCSARLEKAGEEAFERAGLKVEVDPSLSQGFRALGAEGRLMIDATVSALLDRDRSRLSIEVLNRLSEGGGP
jgi:vacuolar-type H+-ATPase subunit E/Vma4